MSDELLDFFSFLRLKGYKIGVRQYKAADHLLSVLAGQELFKGQPERLATWLAPIVCSSPQQQQEFAGDYNEWLKLRPVQAGVADDPEDGAAVRVSHSRQNILNGRRKLTKTYLVIAACILLPIVAVLVAVLSILLQTATIPPVALPSPIPITGKPIPVADKVRVSLEAGASLLTEEQLLNRLPRWKRFYIQHYALVRTVVAGLPLLCLAGFWFWRFKRRLQMEKQSVLKTPDLDDIPIEGASEALFKEPFFRRISQGMRHQRETGVYELDVQATVESTAKLAGLLDPIERPLKSTSEYLMLIDRATFSDQQAKFYDELINKLTTNHVHIERYYFKTDPRNCRKVDPGKYEGSDHKTSYLDLRELRALHPRHVLLIFSEGVGLMDGQTGEPYEWTRQFSDWTNQIIFTPEVEADWSYREFALSRSGFVILPTTKNGLDSLLRVIQSGKEPKAAAHTMAPEFPELLREAAGDWISEDQPEQDKIEELRIGLMQFLDMEDYYWLSACAVYPVLDWQMTVSLGYQLTGNENFEERLIRLVRLPWFRHGKMPDWLRSSLISALPRDQEETIRNTIDRVLLAGEGKPGDSSLAIARPNEDPEARKLKTVWHNLRVRISKLFKSQPPLPPESALRDYVFLSFMSGRKPNKLAVALPAALRPFFTTRSKPWPLLSTPKLAAQAALAFALIFIFFPSKPVLPQESGGQTPNVEVTASPVSGLPGVKYAIKVVSANPQQFSLSDTTLFVAPGAVTQEVKLVTQGATPLQLDSVIDIPLSFSGPMIPLEIRRNDTILGRFNFNLSALTVTPLNARRGSDTTLSIKSARCDAFKFRDATLEGPSGSGITTSTSTIDDCTLTSQVTIPANTPLGELVLLLKAGETTAPITLTVTAVDCPTITINESREGSNTRYTAVVTGGESLNLPGYSWTAIGRDQQGSSIIDREVPFTGQGTSSILISDADQDPGVFLMLEVNVSGFDASCRAFASGGGFPPDCPRVAIALSSTGEDHVFAVTVAGGERVSSSTITWELSQESFTGRITHKDIRLTTGEGQTISGRGTALPLGDSGRSSIIIRHQDIPEPGGEDLVVGVTVSGYSSFCRAETGYVLEHPGCPSFEIKQNEEGPHYRFTLLAKGGMPTSQPPTFKWKVYWVSKSYVLPEFAPRHHAQESPVLVPVPEADGQGTKSIIVDQKRLGDKLVVEVEVSGYVGRCKDGQRYVMSF